MCDAIKFTEHLPKIVLLGYVQICTDKQRKTVNGQELVLRGTRVQTCVKRVCEGNEGGNARVNLHTHTQAIFFDGKYADAWT